jgi:hypothetical protein
MERAGHEQALVAKFERAIGRAERGWWETLDWSQQLAKAQEWSGMEAERVRFHRADLNALEQARTERDARLRLINGDGGQPREPDIVDLDEYLDGTLEAPQPAVGAMRSDGRQFLYPGKWHTCISLTEAGKTWMGLWHAKAVLEAGWTVAYVHFEEGDPRSTISRLLQIGVDRETIRDYFLWISAETSFKPGRMAYLLDDMEPGLLVLDGINAACSRHGWKVNESDAIDHYRSALVRPATDLGAAVLSLGHPPKARDRQTERHGFGSTAWLDEVDGVGFRLVANSEPIGRGRVGSSALYLVKDRNGEAARWGDLMVNSDMEGWYSLGSMIVDDAGPIDLDGTQITTIRLQAPETTDDGRAVDKIDRLAGAILAWMAEHGDQYATQDELKAGLQAARVSFTASDLKPALDRLEDTGRITRPPYQPRMARPGRLVSTAPKTEIQGV